jgi:integrase
MHGEAVGGAPFLELDHAPAPEAWWPDLSETILQLRTTITPVDRAILAPLGEFLARHDQELRQHAAIRAHVKLPDSIHDRHPGSATLFRIRHGRSAGLERLACIGLCALIEAGRDGGGPPRQLLSIVRGALDKSNSPIPGVLGAVESIPELVRLVEGDEPTRNALPPHFLSLWKSWLRDTLTRWMLADPSRLRNQLEPPGLLPQLEDPQIPLSTGNRRDEEGPSATCFVVPACEPRPGESAATEAGRAASNQLERLSAGDLLAPSELRLPRAIDERLCREAVRRGNEHRDHPSEAEPYAALALLLGGGVREVDLREMVWGGEGVARPHAVDPVNPVLYRRLKMPVNAVVPDESIRDRLAPHSDTLAWPLPQSVHSLLLALTAGQPKAGQPVLPRLSAAARAPYRMWDLIEILVPEAGVGALAPRLAFASELASVLGSEIAQLAMADTFGKSSVPAYYGAMPERDLAEVIGKIQSRRFGEAVPIPTGRSGWVGSRLVLTDAAAKQWPAQIRAAQKRASTDADRALAEWRAHRDKLAAALCSATGHRPEDVLGRLTLADVIPEYGLVILQDKQVDALRANRVAATGRLWLSDLRAFLDRLIEIGRIGVRTDAGRLATSILLGESPLFSVPTPQGDVVPMTAATLRDGMPEALRCVDNFYRHRLAQKLIAHRVDPELRHAQLGWVVSPAHLHADLSPRSAVDLGRLLGPVIDEVLVADGWYLPSDRKKRWTWDGVPMPAPVDWKAAFATQKREHEESQKRIRQQLRERWKEREGSVLARLRDAFQEFSPLLRVDVTKKRLVPSIDLAHGITLTADQHALICDRVRLGDQDSGSGLEAAIARILLYRLVRNARKKGLVQGPIPSRPYLSVTSDPSPFLPGLGTAIRHTVAIRRQLEDHAGRKTVRDLGQLTTWAVLAFSMYRRIDWARAAVAAARNGMRAQGRRHVIRLAARIGDTTQHMVFSGAPAVLLVRRKQNAPTASAPPESALDAWAATHLSDDVAWGESGSVAGRIEATLAAAGQIELSGIERWLVCAGSRTAAETPHRCAARDDDAPVQTADLTTTTSVASEKDPALAESPGPSANQRLQRDGYNRFVSLLNKRTLGRTRAENAAHSGAASDGKSQWRRALRLELTKLRENHQADPNLRVLIGYTLDHLQYGSEAGNTLAHNSLRREVTQFGWTLLVLLGERNLLNLDGESLRQIYRQVLMSKTPEARPYAFEELQRFQRFLVRVHSRPSIDLSDLAAIAGTRGIRLDPGLLTPSERRVVEEELVRDHQQECERADANPDVLRLAQLQRLYFLILEASGLRPGSVYGLTLGDLHFIDTGGDRIHVRMTGDYGEAKTRASVGFFLLEGAQWARARDWVQGWVQKERECYPEHWRDRPLFASKAGAWTRVHDHHLNARIGDLLKWVTGNRSAHCYWLRKTRISERFQRLWDLDDVSVRDVYGAMLCSGHATIDTTLERYINDPACLMFADMSFAAEASRSLLLAMSDLAPGPLDMAWSRAADDAFARSGVLLDRMGENCSDIAPERRTTAPILRRAKTLMPRHIDAFAHAMHRFGTIEEAMLAAGITERQAHQFDLAATELILRRGCAPWRPAGQIDGRVVLPVPRRIAGSERWFALLDREPSRVLRSLAIAWVNQPHVARRFGDRVVAMIDPGELADVHDLLCNTGLMMQVVSQGEHHLLAEVKDESGRKGHGAALRWLLAIVWTFLHCRGWA